MRVFAVPLLMALLVTAVPQQEVFRPSLDLDSLHLDDPSLLLAFKTHTQAWPERRLVRVPSHDGGQENHWTTEGEKAILLARGLKFIDITNHPDMWARKAPAADKYYYPTSLFHSKMEATSLIGNISVSRMKSCLSAFSTSFRTRSGEGRRSQKWLFAQVKGIASRHASANITVSEFSHSWGQNSIIARIPRQGGSVTENDGPVVIVSAHQDSTNFLPFLSAPGADDDGSGTTTVLEVLSSLVANSFVPSDHSVEFHWYSAEEGGLLGSQAVAADYHVRGQKVRAMLQLDMTAYVKPGTEERIGIIQDFVDHDLTTFMEKIVAEYTDLPFVPTKCGYACSDHASWTQIGAPSAFVIESSFEDSNHDIHSTRDTIELKGFSFEHMAQFVRLGLGLIIEIAGPATKL